MKAKLLLESVVLPRTQGISLYGCLWSEHKAQIILKLSRSPNGRLCQSISRPQRAEALTTMAEYLQRGLTRLSS